jgi:predicted TIM-barrel fold metal-dependent hydrolase
MPQPRPEVRILEVARKTNNYIADAVRSFQKRLVGFCITTPFTGDDAGVGELYRSVKNLGLKGVKIHECMAMTPLDIDIISPILEKASRLKVPVFMHAGDEGCRAERIGFLAQRFPEVAFIMAHMGGPWYGENAIEVAKYTENIYLETSATASPLTIRRAVREVGFDRVIWGSDVPYQNTAFELAKLRIAGLSKKEFDAVSGKNMARILKLRKGLEK